MRLSKTTLLILLGGLGFVVGTVLFYSLFNHVFWPYELLVLSFFVVFLVILLFLPRCFKDHQSKSYYRYLLFGVCFLFARVFHKKAPEKKPWKSLNRLSSFLATKENQAIALRRVLAVLLNLVFIVRYEWAHDYLESVSRLTSSFLSPFQVGVSAFFVSYFYGALFIVVLAQFLRTPLMESM
jgi:MFS superfamily sulfate permease-like transporter